MNGLQKFLKDNSWNLLITGTAVIIAFASLSTRVSAVEADNARIGSDLDSISIVLERIIVLEEKNRAIQEDIGEIKADIKDIKVHFEIK